MARRSAQTPWRHFQFPLFILADAELFSIALMARSTLYDKIKSNVEELSARDTTLFAISTQDFDLADDLIRIRAYDPPMLEFFEMLVVVHRQRRRHAPQPGQEREVE